MDRPHKIYVCDPDKNTSCENKKECYINGGLCCLTFDPENEATFVDKKTIDKLAKYSYGARLPNIMRGLYSQKKQST